MKVSDYSTEELERLTTLNKHTIRIGEYVKIDRFGFVVWHTAEGSMSCSGRANAWSYALFPLRRVKSFDDKTEIDPPQDEMLAELARRKSPPFKVGDLVMPGDLAMPSDCIEWMTTNGPLPLLRVTSTHGAVGPTYYPHKLFRHATDAEVAAYHRAHCAPPPEKITNRTHAGRRVRSTLRMENGLILTILQSRLFSIPDDGKVWVCTDRGLVQGWNHNNLELL